MLCQMWEWVPPPPNTHWSLVVVLGLRSTFKNLMLHWFGHWKGLQEYPALSWRSTTVLTWWLFLLQKSFSFSLVNLKLGLSLTAHLFLPSSEINRPFIHVFLHREVTRTWRSVLSPSEPGWESAGPGGGGGGGGGRPSACLPFWACETFPSGAARGRETLLCKQYIRSFGVCLYQRALLHQVCAVTQFCFHAQVWKFRFLRFLPSPCDRWREPHL